MVSDAFSGAGWVMTLTQPGLGTDTLVHPLRRGVQKLLLLGYTLQRGPSRQTAGLTLLCFFLIYTSITDISLEQACKYTSAQLTPDLLVLKAVIHLFDRV